MTLHLRTNAMRMIPMRLAGVMLAAAVITTAPAPVVAQETPAAAEARIRKIEAEIRALQRKVFPGGDGRFFEPQIGTAPGTAAATPAPTTGGAPATAVTDILLRLDALEAQLRALTARSEEQANALSLVEARLLALETAANAPIDPAPTLTAAPTVTAPVVPAQVITPAATTPAVRTQAPAAAVPVSAPAAAPSPSRLAAVQAIAKPQTTDAGDDEYSYGFRLWNAGFFPEARQQLTKFVEQYPNHTRISYGRNLLGRSFLDDNLPQEAAKWFLRNYQANKAGERAPDSLLFLGASMVAMNDTKRACIALAEFADTYPLIAAGRLAGDYQATRAKVTCS
jgi:TolA-binding protein